ncbi:MAG: thiamine diphosphokinase [Actinobacteria bacterium]|nr:MAG: thiamine diphosphokinase [Actinomycetota bacterium]
MDTILIFAGGDPIPLHLIEELPDSDMVIAADSGYSVAESLGLKVNTLVGDMDSVTDQVSLDALPSSVSVVRHPEDKDATDLDLALELAAREQPHRVVLVGAEGGRFDHEVGAATTICDDRWAAIPEIDWVRSDSLVHVVRNTRRIQGDPGGLISIIPMGGEAEGVSTSGLKWELNEDTLSPGSSWGVSNRFARTEAVIRVQRGVVLAIIPDQDST